MTSALEFTYLYDGFSLKINENALSRAVRVKTAVKDKIKRLFKSKEVVVNATAEPVLAPVKESLINLEHEKIEKINDILNKLEEQKGIVHNANRAVLFTQPLVMKIRRVSTKWFEGLPRIEKKEEPVSVDMPSVNMINHLGGEVVPGNWNSVVEKEEVNIPLSLEPTLEAVPTMESTIVPKVQTENTVSEPVMEMPVTDIPQMAAPTFEPEVSIPTELEQPRVEPVTQETNIESQIEVPKVNIEIPKVSENTDIYRFPSFDFNMESVVPTVSNEVLSEPKLSDSSYDFVPEPKSLDETNKEEYVSEPTLANESYAFEMPSFESSASDNKVANESEVKATPKVTNSPMEDKIGELLTKKFTPNPANNFVPESVDNRPVEDRIDELLGRNKAAEMSASEPVAISVSEQQEEKPMITQGQIIARLRRVNNEMAERDATIKNLTAKNETLREENAASKEKLTEAESRVSDLTAKNSELASQNERLSAKVEEVEVSSKSTIAKLENKLDEVTQSKTEEIESLKKMVEELKAKHASEISSINERHNAEIKSITETKDRQIQAIYSTISEALGEAPIEEDYSRGMAA